MSKESNLKLVLLDVPYSLTAHANDIYVNPIMFQTKIAEARFTTTCTGYNYEHLLQVAEAVAETPGGQRTSGGQRTKVRELQQRIHLVYHGLDLARYQPVQHPASTERHADAERLPGGERSPVRPPGHAQD